MKENLREVLKTKVLTGDGAMGTYLYQLGFPVGISYEEMNLTKPRVIADVHRRYYEAGARFIETNTFSANREKLSKYGLEKEVEAINRSGVKIAREAVGEDAYVFGAVGSIRGGMRKSITQAELERDFQEQIEILLDAAVDGLLLETFYDLEEMLIALRIVRRLSDLPVVCQFAIEDIGRTQDGFDVADAFLRVRAAGGDIVGFNCRSGPNAILRTMEQMRPVDLPVSVFPNAGIPDYVDGKVTYMASPQYFADNAVKFAAQGARIIGGCCGTTPEHIRAIAEALRSFNVAEALPENAPESQGARPGESVRLTLAYNKAASPENSPEKADGLTLVDLVRERHTVIVELDPPRSLDIGNFLAGAQVLKESGADAVTMADNSLAVTRMSNFALGTLLKERVGVRPLVHIACRDRNLIGTQSHLMGLYAMGINHVLAVTGDPARFGDLPGSSSVYDLTSFEMIRMIKQLNEGLSFSGKPLKQKAQFVVGAAFNPHVKSLDKAVRRLEKKIESGADFIMTQPVYDAALLKEVHDATKHLPVPVFIGIMPLASGRNAEYLHNEVPGIQLSDEVLRRMRGLSGEEGRKEGVAIAKELLDAAVRYFNGIYLITPFLAYEMTAELTKYVWQITGRRDFDLYPISK